MPERSWVGLVSPSERTEHATNCRPVLAGLRQLLPAWSSPGWRGVAAFGIPDADLVMPPAFVFDVLDVPHWFATRSPRAIGERQYLMDAVKWS